MHRLTYIILIAFIPFYAKSQIITTIAGTGSSSYSGEGGPATVAGVPNPGGGAFDKYGNFYFSDGMNSNRIRKITPAGIITTVAGNGMGGFMGDGGPATAARLNAPSAVALDTAGNLYIADAQNLRIRKVNKLTGVISTIGGTGTPGYGPDNIAATSSMIVGVGDICVDKAGNVYIADGTNARVRKIDIAGIITTYAGNGIPGSSGDGGPATSAQLSIPGGICFDDSNNLYIADGGGFGNRVRKVNAAGIISTIAGNGSGTYVGDGIPATNASIAPAKVVKDTAGNVFIGDPHNHRVYKVNALGILHTVAGNGIAGDTGDGAAATAAQLNRPGAIELDPCGNLYVATVGSVSVIGSGRRIRKVTFNPTCDLESLNTTVVSANEGISIYPNPANDELHMDNAKPGTKYDVVSIVGAVVHSGTLQAQENSISIRNLPPGIYMLALTNEQGIRTVHKIIKE